MSGMKTFTSPINVPFVECFGQELRLGDEVIIEGVSQHGSQEFQFNFALGGIVEGSYRSDIAFHFSSRYNTRYVARNNFAGGKWQTEDKTAVRNFPFTWGKHFKIRITVLHDCFNVEVDGSFFTKFYHRVPINKINTLQTTGDVVLTKVQISQSQTKPHLQAIPYVQNFEQQLQPQQEIVITGVSPHGSKEFQINLALGPILEGSYRSDIAFHFNPRYYQRYVARNNFDRGQWKQEDGSGSFPFTVGLHFAVRIAVNAGNFYVEVDGKYFTSFNHRVPVNKITTLQVLGDVELTGVHVPPFQRPYPTAPAVCPARPPVYPMLPKVPFDHMLPYPLSLGKSVRLSGQVPQYATNFRVELVSDGLSHFGDNINLLLNVCLSPPPNSVIRNSKINGFWGKEEISIPHFPFACGANFELALRCEGNRFAILINKVYFCNFSHRLPYHAINKVRVSGDVQITSVYFD